MNKDKMPGEQREVQTTSPVTFICKRARASAGLQKQQKSYGLVETARPVAPEYASSHDRAKLLHEFKAGRASFNVWKVLMGCWHRQKVKNQSWKDETHRLSKTCGRDGSKFCLQKIQQQSGESALSHAKMESSLKFETIKKLEPFTANVWNAKVMEDQDY